MLEMGDLVHARVELSVLMFGDYEISLAGSKATKYREHIESTNSEYAKIPAYGS